MGKGKVIGTVAAAVVIPAAAVVGAIYILPLLDITSSNTLYYFGNDASVAADGTISLGKEEVLGYSSKYSDTMTGYFKAQLDENETYIYNAFMYASENGYSDIFLPEDVFDGSYDRLQEIEYVITFLSCDSPFVAHNYTTNSKLTGNVEQFAGKSYHHIQLETLGAEYTSRREAAYEKAKSVVASIPQECNTDRKKAQYLYNYVAENSVYVTDGYSTRNVPIADLLIDGKMTAFSILHNTCFLRYRRPLCRDTLLSPRDTAAEKGAVLRYLPDTNRHDGGICRQLSRSLISAEPLARL